MFLPQELFKPTSKQNEGHGMGLNAMLDESWSNRCTLTRQSAAPALDVSGAFQPSVCCSLGFCVHAGKGLQAFAMHSKLSKLLRPFVQAVRQKRKVGEAVQPSDSKRKKPVHPEARKLLDRAMLIFRLQNGDPDVGSFRYGQPLAEAEADSAWASVADKILLDAGQAVPAASETHWLHVGYINHTTHVFSVTPMTLVDFNSSGHVVKLSALQQGQAGEDVVQSFRSFEFFKANLDLEQVWRLRVFKLRSTSEVLTRNELSPACVQASPYDEIPEMIVWQGWKAEQANPPPQHSRRSQGPGGRAARPTARPSGSDSAVVPEAPPGAGVFSDHELAEHDAAEGLLKEASDLLSREEAPDSDPERELDDDPPLPSDISVERQLELPDEAPQLRSAAGAAHEVGVEERRDPETTRRVAGPASGPQQWQVQIAEWQNRLGISDSVDVLRKVKNLKLCGLQKNKRIMAILNLSVLQKLKPGQRRSAVSVASIRKACKTLIVNVSQNPNRGNLITPDSGFNHTLCSSTLQIHLGLRRLITAREMMFQHGHPRDMVIPTDMSVHSLRQLAGQGMALPSVATCLWCQCILKANSDRV
ncbi:unnamed protein product [Symbiodinium sp. CCMP2592]|nr:unnamed protein product [Symbiodinium sp. CCMP2592]